MPRIHRDRWRTAAKDKALAALLPLLHAATAPNAAHSATRDFLDRNSLVSAAIFVLTVVAIVLISWAGMTTSNFAVLPDQLATVRVTANAAIVYESAEKTRAERAQFLDRLPPVLGEEGLLQARLAAHEVEAAERLAHPVARAVAGNAPGAVRDSLRMARLSLSNGEEAAWVSTPLAEQDRMSSPEATEGVRAFIDKRAPSWRT